MDVPRVEVIDNDEPRVEVIDNLKEYSMRVP